MGLVQGTYALFKNVPVKTCQALGDDVLSWEGICKSLKYKGLNFYFCLAFVGVADGESRTWPILPTVSHKVVHIPAAWPDGSPVSPLNSRATMTV